MPINFTQHLGASSRREVMESGLISDGRRLALGFNGLFHVVEGFWLKDVAITQRHDGITEYEFSLVAAGGIRQHTLSDVRSIFQNAADLSVDDLLKLVYQRMDERPS